MAGGHGLLGPSGQPRPRSARNGPSLVRRHVLRLILGLWRPKLPRGIGVYEVLLYPAIGTLEWLRRHALVIAELERLRGDRSSLTVLDFGGAGGALARALEIYGRAVRYQVVSADIDPAAEMVLDPDGPIPAPDGSFDVVVSSDVFEHIAAGDRGRWLTELARIATLGQVHTFPADDLEGKWAGESADLAFNAWFRRRYGYAERWTAEHIENGLPTVEEMLALCPGATVTGFANAQVWVGMLIDQNSSPNPLRRLLFGLRYLVRDRQRDLLGPWKAALLVVRSNRADE
jgi:SAM-dependent methyltransferase